MSIALERFCFNVLLAKAAAVVLSTWMGVGGWGWPSSVKQVRRGILSWAAKKFAPISASAALAMTNLMIFEMTWIGPLIGTKVGAVFLGAVLRKKWAPALLRAFGAERYEASLWMCRHISLAT